MRSRRIWQGLALAAILFLAFAWFDGGEEPMREIVEPVALPGAAQ